MLQTVDVDANLVGEVTLVCGSFFCFSSAAEMDADATTMDAMTAVCGSFFCFSSAAEMAMASAVDLDATTDADANILNTV